MPYRTGRAQIRTCQELRETLTLPVFYILIGRAQVAFPNTATPHQSLWVQVIRTGSVLEPDHEAAFPAFCNWKQWNEIIVPILKELRWSAWLGSPGATTGETSTGQPANLPGIQLGPGVYACNASLRDEYIRLLGSEIERLAGALGYVC